MSGKREVTYALDFGAGGRDRKDDTGSSAGEPDNGDGDGRSIPRIARLVALAIRFEGLLRDRTFRDPAELARLGGVTRARMSQIMQLRHLAPDIQEEILFLPLIAGLNERNLRPVVSRIDWSEQRLLFRKVPSVKRFFAQMINVD